MLSRISRTTFQAFVDNLTLQRDSPEPVLLAERGGARGLHEAALLAAQTQQLGVHAAA